jgi:nifR3 family TIM-barrel protein
MTTRSEYRRLLAETPVLAAPMCGISDFAYRSICREAGARLTYTQMVSSEAIWRGDRKSVDILDLQPQANEAPIAMQLFGGQAEAMAHAAGVLQDLGAAAVDINMGCPAKKITCAHAGSALLRDLPRVRAIFQEMRRVVRVPLTVKMRWDWDDGQEGQGAAVEVARMAEAEGLDGVCLHARTREQGYSGAANWELIALLREAAPGLALIGNGDVRSPADALAMMRQSGCDAVMIGRAAIGDPWLLGAALRAVREGRGATGETESDGLPAWPERRRMMIRHAGLMVESRGDPGLVLFRKHAAAYLRGLPGAKHLRTHLMKVQSLEELEAVLPVDAPVVEPAAAEQEAPAA